MTDFFNFLVAGLSLGAVYALVALGFVVMFRATGVINFAQGSLVVLGCPSRDGGLRAQRAV